MKNFQSVSIVVKIHMENVRKTQNVLIVEVCIQPLEKIVQDICMRKKCKQLWLLRKFPLKKLEERLWKEFRPGESFSSVLNRVRTDIPQSTQPTNLNSQHNVSIPTSQQEDLTPNNSIPENPVISVASGKKDASHDNMRNKDLLQTLPHTNGVPSTSGVITKSSTSTVPHPKNAPSTNGVPVKSCTTGRRKAMKKRERTPDENSSQGVKDNETPSQAPTVIPKNPVKLKRLENK